jgi:hypothetical protein
MTPPRSEYCWGYGASGRFPFILTDQPPHRSDSGRNRSGHADAPFLRVEDPDCKKRTGRQAASEKSKESSGALGPTISLISTRHDRSRPGGCERRTCKVANPPVVPSMVKPGISLSNMLGTYRNLRVESTVTCEGETIVANRHGALISTTAALKILGMKIEIQVYLTAKRAKAEVVYVDPQNPCTAESRS